MALPADIIQLVFDDLPLETLILASHVCKEWRVIAHAHPTFSRNIEFTSLTTPSPPAFHADLLTARVMATSGALNLCLYVSRFPRFTEAVVLPLLAQCLHRVVELRIIVHGSLASDMLLVLERPAPRLNLLRLGALNAGYSITLGLSPRFLGGSAARLETLYTHGFSCTPSTADIPALAATKSLIYECPHDGELDSSAVQGMLGFLPRLEKIYMAGSSWPGDWSGYRISAPLRSLEIYTDGESDMPAPLLAAFTSMDLTHAVVEGSRIGAEAFAILVHPLVNDLALEILWKDEEYRMWSLRLRDVSQTVRRMDFYDPPGTSEHSDISRLIPLYHAISHRITSVSMPVEFWGLLVDLVTELPALTTLVLSSVLVDPDSHVLEPLGCPKLKTLDICSIEHEPIHVPWLANFLGHTLGCTVRTRLTLLLRGCQLDGDPNMVWGYCDEIRLLRP